ncbi:MAG: hypothetical protein HOW73_01110 [Polyangiaceae bacterium]|nr:hypothetical protein [Polyangiaceae bacterium]
MRFEPKTPSFRLRAFTLALVAAAMGFAALILALAGERAPIRAKPPADAEAPWPDGFVEWKEETSAPPASSSAEPDGSASSGPAREAPSSVAP